MTDLYPELGSVDDLGVSATDRSSSAIISGRGMRQDRTSDGDESLGLPALRDTEGSAQPGASVRTDLSGGGLAGAEALNDLLGRVFMVGPWVCYHEDCPNRYPHARMLTTHLIELHGEAATR